jgi:hypothetical protein
MPTRYICNSFSIQMAPKGGCLRFRPITTEKARMFILYPRADMTISNAIGHEETAAIADSQMQCNKHVIRCNRISIQLESKDDLIICQYIGPRLPPGATTLPEGAEINWYYAAYTHLDEMTIERTS